jgi:hypothetical protein
MQLPRLQQSSSRDTVFWLIACADLYRPYRQSISLKSARKRLFLSFPADPIASLPHDAKHVSHLSPLSRCNRSSFPVPRAHAPSQSSAVRLRWHPLAAACGDCDDDGECRIQCCTCTGHLVGCSAQRRSSRSCGYICWEPRFIRGGFQWKCV